MVFYNIDMSEDYDALNIKAFLDCRFYACRKNTEGNLVIFLQSVNLCPEDAPCR
jgi:hypothetical protein